MWLLRQTQKVSKHRTKKRVIPNCSVPSSPVLILQLASSPAHSCHVLFCLELRLPVPGGIKSAEVTILVGLCDMEPVPRTRISDPFLAAFIRSIDPLSELRPTSCPPPRMPDSGERLMENYPKLDRIYNKTISLLGDPKNNSEPKRNTGNVEVLWTGNYRVRPFQDLRRSWLTLAMVIICSSHFNPPVC